MPARSWRGAHALASVRGIVISGGGARVESGSTNRFAAEVFL